jgi:endonuclease/exonuclease/phosphatase (EEP) superfamily protein YafD
MTMAHRHDICRGAQLDSVKLVIPGESVAADMPAPDRPVSDRNQSPLERRVESVAVCAAISVLAATSLAAAARWSWLGDLAVHFRVQYAAVALAALTGLAWTRRWVWAGASFLAFALNVAAAGTVLSPTPGRAVAVEPARAAALRVAAINVLYSNTHYERVTSFLRTARPDLAVLVEITPAWRAGLAGLAQEFPHQYYAAGFLNRAGAPVQRGVLLLSRWPIERVATWKLGTHTEPALLATLTIRGRTLQLIGVHAAWPLGPDIQAERNRELGELAALARRTPRPLLVMGDLNITPFSPHFQALLSETGLQSAAEGEGWQPTWPTFLPPAGIQIDHALVSSGLAVVAFQRGPAVGSDHRPILVDLLF